MIRTATKGLTVPQIYLSRFINRFVTDIDVKRRIAIAIIRLNSPINFIGAIGVVAALYQFFSHNIPSFSFYGIIMTAFGAYIQERTSFDKPYQIRQFFLRNFREPSSYWITLFSDFPIHIMILITSVSLVIEGVNKFAYGIVAKSASPIVIGILLVAFGNIVGFAWVYFRYKINKYSKYYFDMFNSRPGMALRRVRRLGWRLIIAGSLLQLSGTFLSTPPVTSKVIAPTPTVKL